MNSPMNDLHTTPRMASSNGQGASFQGSRMAQSAADGQMPIGAMGWNSGGTDSGNEALARSCEESALKLEALVDDFERIGWANHASYVQTMASHLGIYAHQIRGRANK